MSELVIISAKGSVHKPNDANGAFLPWGRFYAKQADYNVSVKAEINLTTLPLTRKANVRNALLDAKDYDTVTFFGHGYNTGLQLGYAGPAGMKALGLLFARKGITTLRTYACSFGGGSTVLQLFEHCPSLQLIIGHTTAGHTACNPNVIYLVRGQEPVFAIDGARTYGDPKVYRGRMGVIASVKGPHRFPLDVMRQDPRDNDGWKKFWGGVK